MNAKTYLFLLLFWVVVVHLDAQDVRQCDATSSLEDALIQHPELAQKRAEVESNIQAFLTNGKTVNRDALVIPIVFHVVYFSESENISDQQIYSQIAVLNRDYRKKNSNLSSVHPDFQKVAADIGFEFCLAEKDPFGNETNGITRTQTPYPNIGIKNNFDGRKNIYYSDLGGEDAWDTQKYLNVWVCRMGDNILGTGSFPGGAIPSEVGVVIDLEAFGTMGTAQSPNNLGKTLVHEIGHYFDLQHVWGNVIGDCNVDDGIADTPEQERPTRGCPIERKVSCGSFDMYNDYMDYSDDACLAMFTFGQKERMLAALQTARPNLLNTDICSEKALESPLEKIKLHTNPVDDELFLSLTEGNIFEASATFYDVWGQVVLATELFYFPGNYPIDVSHLPQGLYFVVLSSSDAQVVRKIIVNH